MHIATPNFTLPLVGACLPLQDLYKLYLLDFEIRINIIQSHTAEHSRLCVADINYSKTLICKVE